MAATVAVVAIAVVVTTVAAVDAARVVTNVVSTEIWLTISVSKLVSLIARITKKAKVSTRQLTRSPLKSPGEGCPPDLRFTHDTIGEDLYRNTQLCGYDRPTHPCKIQCALLRGRGDIYQCSKTGSGKTAGFLFPIIMSMIIKRNGDPSMTMLAVGLTPALVLAPT
jgi:superfamily II DNA/RNA helicase